METMGLGEGERPASAEELEKIRRRTGRNINGVPWLVAIVAAGLLVWLLAAVVAGLAWLL